MLVRWPAEFLAPIGNRVVGEGSDVVWSGSLAGTELRYQWKRNGVSIVGGSAAVLRLGSVGAVDGGVYTLEVENGTGPVSSSGTLVVVPAVKILEQPKALTVKPGEAAQFSVQVSEAAAGT